MVRSPRAHGPSAHSVRNPARSTQATRHRTGESDATKQSKALKRAQNKRDRLALEEACDDFAEKREDEIERLSTIHSVKASLVRKMLCHTTKIKTRRAMTLRNAIVHDRSVRAKLGMYALLLSLAISYRKPAGDTGRVLSDLQEELADAVEAGEAEVDAETLGPTEVARLFNQLAEYRALKRRGIRATNKSAAMDGQQTATGIGELVSGTSYW
jgi:hypothetical protein